MRAFEGKICSFRFFQLAEVNVHSIRFCIALKAPFSLTHFCEKISVHQANYIVLYSEPEQHTARKNV